MTEFPESGKPSRAKVAAAAGVSVATVSASLLDPETVSPAVRERVLKVVKDLGYQPSANRRPSLRLIGTVLPDPSHGYYSRLLAALEAEVSRSGGTLLVATSHDDPADEFEAVRALARSRVGGIIVAPSQRSDGPWVADLRKARVGVVLVDREIELDGRGRRFKGSFVGIDNTAAAAEAVDHLRTVHHRSRIACLTGPKEATSLAARVTGWQQAHPEWRAEDLLQADSISAAAGYQQGLQLFRRPEADRPDGILISSDEQAMGLVRAAYEHGIRLGSEISLVAFDGNPNDRFAIPTLASICQPMDAIARQAINACRRQASERTLATERILLETKLEPGESCGCL